MDETGHCGGKRSRQIPAFGSWDYEGDLPFTQCFETARNPFRYSFSDDRDLYVAGDLYENDVVTPAVIVVPRRKCGKEWIVKYSGSGVKSPKAVDEDLYRISPELLRSKSKKNKGSWSWLFFSFSSCLKKHDAGSY